MQQQIEQMEELEPLTASSSVASADPPAHTRPPPARMTGNGGAYRAGPKAPPPSQSASSAQPPVRARGKSRLLAALFLLLGLAVLLVMRGEEEVEMEQASSIGGGMPANPSGLPEPPLEPVPEAPDVIVTPPNDDAEPVQPPVAPEAQQPEPEQPKEPVAEEEPNAKPAEEEEEEQEAPKEPQTKEEKEAALLEKYGEWHFWDGEPENRPKDDYASQHPHRDIPEEDFPDSSWQVDAVYANHFLNDASNLASRAEEAIFEEYGHGKPLSPELTMERSKMTKLHKIDLADATAQPPADYMDNGGWTTKRSFDGLVRRLLHSVMSNDVFTVVIVGDGPMASGAGNHFAQTYGMQFESIMAPIFARLNTKFVVRHMTREDGGGGGPLLDGLGFADLISGGSGDDGVAGVDLLVWDSSGLDIAKAAPTFDAELDMLIRQAALGGEDRIPYIMDAGGMSLEVLRSLHEKGGMDVGGLGMGWAGIVETESDKQAKTLPWAARYLKCKEGKEDLCEKAENKYLNTCWADQKGVNPPTKQVEHIAGAGKVHPGWRYHQLKGRMLAVSVLEALQEAINTWSDVTITAGHPLPNEYWHVTDYYKDIREKINNLDADVGSCGKLKDYLPERMCKVAVHGRTEYTPRIGQEETSISSMIKPAGESNYVPKVEDKMVYEGPNEPNPVLALPEDAFDVRFIVSAGIRRRLRRLGDDDNDDKSIVPGLGWQIHGELPGKCDGSSAGICGRQETSSCLLDDHMASKGGVLGNEFSGWLVFTVKDVKEGVIVLALETSHDPNESTRTEGWTEARTSEKQEEKKEEEEEQAKEEEKKGADNDDAQEEDVTKKKDDSDNRAEKDDNKNKEESDGDEDGDKLRRLRRRRLLKSADQASSQSDRILLPDQFKCVQLISILLFHRYRYHQSSFTCSLTYLLLYLFTALLCHLYIARVATDLNMPSVAKSQRWTRNPSRTG